MNHYLRRELTQARATGLDLPDPLKTLGTYKVAIKVYPGMSPEGTIVVEPKG
jgi:ribosomal protein L9